MSASVWQNACVVIYLIKPYDIAQRDHARTVGPTGCVSSECIAPVAPSAVWLPLINPSRGNASGTSDARIHRDLGLSRGVQQVGRSVQAGATLLPGVSQQAFKHATGMRVAGVIAAHVTPMSKILIDGTGFG